MRRASVAMGVVALMLVAAGELHAAEADTATLEQQVKALRATVLELEARIVQLEARAPAQPPSTPEVAQTAPATQNATPAVAAAAAVAPAPAVAPIAAATPGTSAGYVSAEAALRASWSKVKQQMDQDEVTRLLGEPSKKTTLDGRTVWYYYYPGAGSGSVFFTDAGRVSSRQSPFGLGW